MSSTLFTSKLPGVPNWKQETTRLLEIADGLIVSVRPGSQEEADHILPSGQVLMPGMVDCHSHLALCPPSGHLGLMEDSEAKQTIRALKVLQDNLRAGITGLRSVGDRYYLDVLLGI